MSIKWNSWFCVFFLFCSLLYWCWLPSIESIYFRWSAVWQQCLMTALAKPSARTNKEMSHVGALSRIALLCRVVGRHHIGLERHAAGTMCSPCLVRAWISPSSPPASPSPPLTPCPHPLLLQPPPPPPRVNHNRRNRTTDCEGVMAGGWGLLGTVCLPSKRLGGGLMVWLKADSMQQAQQRNLAILV